MSLKEELCWRHVIICLYTLHLQKFKGRGSLRGDLWALQGGDELSIRGKGVGVSNLPIGKSLLTLLCSLSENKAITFTDPLKYPPIFQTTVY